MKFNFKSVVDRDLQTSVPEGIYPCRVTEVREGTSRDGSPRWNMRLEVIAGEFAGRTAGWDSLTWSDRGVYRVQQVLCALGVDARGEVELEASELIGCEARVQFELEEREDPLTGRRRMRLRVPYAGFEPADAAAAGLPARQAANGDASAADGAVTWGATKTPRDGDAAVGIDAEGASRGSSADGPSLEDSAAAAF